MHFQENKMPWIYINLDVYKAFSMDQEPGLSTGSALIPRVTLGDVWRHGWSSQLEERRCHHRGGGARAGQHWDGQANTEMHHPLIHVTSICHRYLTCDNNFKATVIKMLEQRIITFFWMKIKTRKSQQRSSSYRKEPNGKIGLDNTIT